ncbi:hypothetical protein ABNG02_03365 [Halorubrum ejinorense]|uniref:Small CPxCG-related zinc finger protein n=1 Tax=Halorubrum ejinorense TaxID=425309 RepID=A0ABV4III3_9EURY
MNVVTRERTRTCIRCHERFTEPAGTVTRICDDCPSRTTAPSASTTAEPSDASSPSRSAAGEGGGGDGRSDGGGRNEGGGRSGGGGGGLDRNRERECLRCGEAFLEGPGEIARLCPSCDPDKVRLRDR